MLRRCGDPPFQRVFITRSGCSGGRPRVAAAVRVLWHRLCAVHGPARPAVRSAAREHHPAAVRLQVAELLALREPPSRRDRPHKFSARAAEAQPVARAALGLAVGGAAQHVALRKSARPDDGVRVVYGVARLEQRGGCQHERQAQKLPVHVAWQPRSAYQQSRTPRVSALTTENPRQAASSLHPNAQAASVVNGRCVMVRPPLS